MANFERLAIPAKLDLGKRVLSQIRKGKPSSHELWALSRFGGRIPFHGPLDRVVPPSDAASWAQELLKLNLPMNDALAHALVQLVRRTGDRARDVASEVLDSVKHALSDRHPKPDTFAELLDQPETASQDQEREWLFGEALPSGLVLSSAD